jgi:dihydropteroate synthase/2-amino-4-hydroxy-6-hydroxymethyldihydropteridine diphosphokinase
MFFQSPRCALLQKVRLNVGTIINIIIINTMIAKISSSATATNKIFPTMLLSHRKFAWRTISTLSFRGGHITTNNKNSKTSTTSNLSSSPSHSDSSFHNDSTISTINKSQTIMATLKTSTKNSLLIAKQPSRKYRVYLAVGSNLGNCFQNIQTGLSMLCDSTYHPEGFQPTDFVKSSFLYLTAPMYVTNQPPFWNGAVEISTDLDPHALLHRLKLIEQDMGRILPTQEDDHHNHHNNDAVVLRNGPRPLDLDILLYYNQTPPTTTGEQSDNDSTAAVTTTTAVLINSHDLIIPHPRLGEREFVLAPLVDVTGRNLTHPLTHVTMGELLDDIMIANSNKNNNNNNKSDDEAAVRIIPLPSGRALFFNQTIVMGILNVTPDSFSDGGLWLDVDQAIDRAMEMIVEGATIIDIGAESTRPGAKEVSADNQIARVIPLIRGIREKTKDIVLSIDTRHAAVAKAAIEAGADMVNDVSGGMFDNDMLTTVAQLQVPMVLMHMRGTPDTMQDQTNYEEGVVDSVVHALLERSQIAEAAGIPKWLQILDLGIGFAKDLQGNLSLLKHYSEIQSRLHDFPLLLGTSRKGFIGTISGERVAADRDYGTVGSCVTALCLGRRTGNGRIPLGCHILRVHNVRAAKHATSLMDAIVKAD